MSALQQIDNVLDHFEPMDKDSICSDQPMQDLSNETNTTTNINTKEQKEPGQEEKFSFDVNSFECMPCEKNLLYDFQKWMNLEFITDKKTKQTRKTLHLQLLNQHPFVKQTGNTLTYDYPHHKFIIQRYQLNCRAFNVWCRKNRKWKSKAGGNTITDDGLYTVSLILRKIIPRGFHAIYVKNKNKSNTETKENEFEKKLNISDFDELRFFRGIPKFTGLLDSDEDEKSNSHANSSSFLYRNYKLSDCISFVNTCKSNGENCKLSVLTFDNKSYAVSGSKNTCEIWPINQHSSKYFDHNILYPSGWIARIYSNWLLSLQQNDKILFAKFVREMSIDNEYIIMGEINEPWMEHIIPINDIFIEVYTVLDNGSKDGLPIHCKKTFDLFNNYKMDAKYYANKKKLNVKSNVFTNAGVIKQDRFMNALCIKHVTYSLHNKSELNAVIDRIRKETTSEGSVLYLLNKNDVVIGLCKVKASSYVVRRRIRERCRSKLFRPLLYGLIKDYRSSRSKKDGKWTLNEAKDNAKEHLRKGMGKMGHVPNHQILKYKWIEFAMGFVDWWVQYKLGKKKNVTHVDLVLLELDQRFASVVQEYADFKYKGYSPV